MRPVRSVSIASLALLLVSANARPVPILSGDLLIANHDSRVRGRAGIVKVDPVTGAQTLLSRGGLFGQPNDVVLGLSGKLYVADSSAEGDGAILSIVPRGAQEILDSAPSYGCPEGITIEPDGNLIVPFSCNGPNDLVRIDPDTGGETVLATLPAQGFRVSTESDGQILVAMVAVDQILRVDPVSGSQSVVSAGGLLTDAWDLDVASNGDIIVLNNGVTSKKVLRIDPITGAQSVVSSDGLLVSPYGLAVGNNGDIFVVDTGGSPTADGKAIRVDPVSGAQSILAQGRFLVDPLGITVVP